MAHDVFISYSTKDKPIADAVCAAIEANKFRCWIAPRDILPGKSWPEAITQAIASCKIMVLIFSTDSSSSEQVKREISVAIDENVILVPFKIGEPPLQGELKFYLKSTHWLDAMDPPTEHQIGELVEKVSLLMDSKQINGTGSGNTPSPRKSLTSWFRRAKYKYRNKYGKGFKKVMIWSIIIAVILFCASLIEVVPKDPNPGSVPTTTTTNYSQTLTLPEGYPVEIVPIIQNAQIIKSTKGLNNTYNISYVVSSSLSDTYGFYRYYLGRYENYTEYRGYYGEIQIHANYVASDIKLLLYTNINYTTTVEIVLSGV